MFVVFHLVKYLLCRYKNFDDLIEGNIQRKGWELIKSEYPGFLNVGPFSKVEKEYQVRDLKGMIMADKIYYRVLTVRTK